MHKEHHNKGVFAHLYHLIQYTIIYVFCQDILTIIYAYEFIPIHFQVLLGNLSTIVDLFGTSSSELLCRAQSTNARLPHQSLQQSQSFSASSSTSPYGFSTYPFRTRYFSPETYFCSSLIEEIHNENFIIIHIIAKGKKQAIRIAGFI